LASPALQKIALYDSRCPEFELTIMHPQQQDEMLEVIRAVKAKNVSAKNVDCLNTAAEQLAHAGAESIVLGCTEFSLLAEQVQVDLPVFDSLQVLADDMVKRVKS